MSFLLLLHTKYSNFLCKMIKYKILLKKYLKSKEKSVIVFLLQKHSTRRTDNLNQNQKILVDSGVLPDVFLKVLKVKQWLHDEEETSTSVACKKAGISRSAFYKYKDHVFAYEDTGGKTVTLHAVLTDRAGILSMFMSVLYESGANILTVNQNIPSGKRAPVSVSFKVTNSDFSVANIIDQLKQIDGVKSVHQVLGE